MTQVLQYRFGGLVGNGEHGAGNGRSELQGHAFGNLLLAALTGVTGSFDEALLAAEKGAGDARAGPAVHPGGCDHGGGNQRRQR
jgi:2-phospho-L-lactate transferase/gluconeogenesis factor (CofD/UPF0052 family)